MRIAFVPQGSAANTVYRSIGPMTELSRRGHEIRRLELSDQGACAAAVRWCDLLHVHRQSDRRVLELVRAAKAAGAAIVWDDDDDAPRFPRELANIVGTTKREASAWLVTRRRIFELVDLVTTTSGKLAEVFRSDGAREVQVIENYVIDRYLRHHIPKNGICIGWAARFEHRLDLRHIPLVRTFEALLAEHPQLHVVTMGISLDQLKSERYRYIPGVPMEDFMPYLTGFDVGIAPLAAQVPINHARSNVKLKEYAAVGVPWLASPIGPYAGLGEREGGRLVPDHGWHEALDTLIRNDRTRRRLAKRATKWGRAQLLSRNIEHWEYALEAALARASSAPRPARAGIGRA